MHCNTTTSQLVFRRLAVLDFCNKRSVLYQEGDRPGLDLGNVGGVFLLLLGGLTLAALAAVLERVFRHWAPQSLCSYT